MLWEGMICLAHLNEIEQTQIEEYEGLQNTLYPPCIKVDCFEYDPSTIGGMAVFDHQQHGSSMISICIRVSMCGVGPLGFKP